MASSAVDVCICTYERQSLEQTLESVAQMDFDKETFQVIIADNALTDQRRSRIEGLGKRFGLRLTYVHAPSRNISIARNACLEASTAPLVAFIDDDETVSEGWLRELVAKMADPAVDCVFGPVKAIFPDATPTWLRDGSLHDMKVTIGRGGVVKTGYTCNAIVRRHSIGICRFNVELGRSGGEDSVFFFGLFMMGKRFEFSENAVVFERVPVGRLDFFWLVRRYFRNGQTHGRLIQMAGESIILGACLALAKALFCMALALLTLSDGARRSKSLIRASMHTGVFLRLIGVREITLY
jgi:succinoglycan biosynthesis protein ExoM